MEEEKVICSKIKLMMWVRVQTSFNDLSKTENQKQETFRKTTSLYFSMVHLCPYFLVLVPLILPHLLENIKQSSGEYIYKTNEEDYQSHKMNNIISLWAHK